MGGEIEVGVVCMCVLEVSAPTTHSNQTVVLHS